MKKITKQDLSFFIDSLNGVISDPLFNPQYKGGKYISSWIESDDHASFTLTFQEGKDKLVLIHKSSEIEDDEQLELFIQICYITTFRNILFGVDVDFGTIINPMTSDYIFYLSTNTLLNEGLKRLRDWNESSKKCWECGKQNMDKTKACAFCKAEF